MKNFWARSVASAYGVLVLSTLYTVAQSTGAAGQAPHGGRVGIGRELYFSSKLMGYYRLPSQQSFFRSTSDPACPLPNQDHRGSPDAEVFIESLGNRPSDSVLVGTGDNFAPNYYSRVLAGANRAGRPSPPQKELYSWDGAKWLWYEDVQLQSQAALAQLRQGSATIPTDNVGCFLSYARYDAVTPGKHDFYYGPERLRQIARFLATLPEKDESGRDSRFPPVQMLAANLMIKTMWAKEHPPIPDSGKPPLQFTTKYFQVPSPPKSASATAYRSLEIEDFTDSGFAFPWMRFIRINIVGTWPPLTELKSLLEVHLCEAEPNNPDDFLNRCALVSSERLSLDPDATEMAQSDSRPGALVYDLPKQKALQPGHNYAICIRPPELTIDHRNDSTALNAKPYCLRFSVYSPFLQYPNWNDAGHNDPKGRYKSPHLWKLREGDAKTAVVIFGVVDPQLQEHVGGDNFAWKSVQGTPAQAKLDDRYVTKIAVADPVRTLIHLQDYFEEEYRNAHPGKEFEGIRVLLAQMPPEAAKQLAEHLPKCLRFDVIVSAADDALATPNQSVQYRPTPVKDDRPCKANVGASGLKMKGPRIMNGALAGPPTFIGVPPSHEQAPALPATPQPDEQISRFVQIRRLQIAGDGLFNVSFVLDGDPMPVRVPGTSAQASIEDRFWLAVCNRVYRTGTCHLPGNGGVAMTSTSSVNAQTISWDASVKRTALQQLALWAIRERTHADVAFLQQRDFYWGGLGDYLAEHCEVIQGPNGQLQCDSNSPMEVDTQEILDRVIWKGDFILVESVKGSVLKNVLRQSDQFKRSEKLAYLPLNESGRPLVTFGIQPDDKNGGDYLVNDRPLDPNALYAVATSDYVGLGDTGYPDLTTRPVGDSPVPASGSATLVAISGATCEILARDAAPGQTGCNTTLNPEDYYDELVNRSPDDPRKGNTAAHKLYAWSFFHGSLGQPVPETAATPPPGPDDIFKEMQERVDAEMNWQLSLEKASFGFSGLAHTDSEKTLSSNFGGVQNSQVNAKHSHSWDWDLNTKMLMFGKNLDWFASEAMQYSSSFTAQASGARSETQSRNRFAVEAGTYLHPWAVDKKLWQLSAVVAAHFETQVANPLANINLSPVPPSTSSSALTFKQGRTRLLLGRLGARFQDRKSYVEAGLEGGETLNAIDSFRVETSPGGPVASCFLLASTSLSKCINSFNALNPTTPVTDTSLVAVIRSPQARYGVYWNIGVTVPINSKLSYSFEEGSDYFFNSAGDNSADTRFRHQLVNSLRFTVFPNLSFEPTYTLFFYENKVDYHFLLQQQYTVKINYSFDWSNLHERREQLRYKK